MKKNTLTMANEENKTFRKYAPLILYALGLIILVIIVWYAIDVFLLVFAAILLAIFLNSIGSRVKKVTKLPYPLALTLSILLILAILYVTFWLYSPLISEQMQTLTAQLPKSIQDITAFLKPYFNWTDFFQRGWQRGLLLANEKILAHLGKIFTFTFGTIVGFFIFFLLGLYLAYTPDLYFSGFINLFPPQKRERLSAMLKSIGTALRYWILGKSVSMIITGILVYIGLLLLHVSLAFILGLISGLLTFIPYIGPILAAIPALLIAFTQRPILALWVLILYLGIHILEGYFITPFIEQTAVKLPPALTIVMQILLTVLVGFMGLALATPLTVVLLALLHNFQERKADFV